MGNPSAKRPKIEDMLGVGWVNNDVTQNRLNPPEQSIKRQDLPGHGQVEDTLDRFSLGCDDNNYDFSEDENDDDHAVPEEETDAAVARNSQLNPLLECPSTINPNRLVHQNRAVGGRKKK